MKVATGTSQMNVKKRKVFIGGLPHSVTDEELKIHFSTYGEIEDYVVMVDRATGKPRGFGFVTFSTEDPVDLVMAEKDNQIIKGKWIDCKRAQPKEEIDPESEGTEVKDLEEEKQPKEEKLEEEECREISKSQEPLTQSLSAAKSNNFEIPKAISHSLFSDFELGEYATPFTDPAQGWESAPSWSLDGSQEPW